MITHNSTVAHPETSPGITDTQWHFNFCWNNACELLHPYQHEFKTSDQILDVGCGTGVITAWLAQKVPEGQVYGIDNLDSAIFSAQQTYSHLKNLKFLMADAGNLSVDHLLACCNIPAQHKFDWIVAFNSLHWCHEEIQTRFLKSAREMLSPQGKLLITLGMRHEPIWSLAETIIHSNKWAGYFENFSNPRAFYTPESYGNLLAQAGWKNYALQTKNITYCFTDQCQFEHIIVAGLPLIKALPIDLRQDIIHEIGTQYASLCPALTNGEITMTFTNLEVVA